MVFKILVSLNTSSLTPAPRPRPADVNYFVLEIFQHTQHTDTRARTAPQHTHTLIKMNEGSHTHMERAYRTQEQFQTKQTNNVSNVINILITTI